jgi:hypothetical protein
MQSALSAKKIPCRHPPCHSLFSSPGLECICCTANNACSVLNIFKSLKGSPNEKTKIFYVITLRREIENIKRDERFVSILVESTMCDVGKMLAVQVSQNLNHLPPSPQIR